MLLNLWREFDRVCRKHGLRYWAVGGTLLGAARHKGFIPWDDDMDVAMPRQDYERLKQLGAEFGEPYFMQTPETDPEYGYSFMKIRDSQTTCVVEKFRRNRFNHGIFLDVFPLDYATEADYAERRQRIAGLIQSSAAYMKTYCAEPTERDREAIRRHLVPGRRPADIFREIERVASEDEREGGEIRTTLVSLFTDDEHSRWPSSAFASTETMAFEGLEMAVPGGWRDILAVQYGDWRQFPPEADRGTRHDCRFITGIAYTRYLSL